MSHAAENKILTKAKMGLLDPAAAKLGGSPVFYSSILFALKQEWTDAIPTAAVDGKSIFINPDWFCNSLSDNERIGLLAHEVCHIGFQHLTTFALYNKKKYSPELEHGLWNNAGDHVINLSLLKAGYDLPVGGLFDDRFEGMTTFQVYAILHKEMEANYAPGKGYVISNGSGLGGDVIFPTGSGTDPAKDATSKLQKDITSILAKAQLSAGLAGESAGNIPGEISRTLADQISPRLPFEIILANYMSSYAKEDYSFRRCNRRFLPDIYIPGAYSENLCNIACAFDVSGSVGDATLTSFRNGIRIISEELKPEKITLLEFDTRICGEKEITSSTDIMGIKFHGGGGTQLQPVVDWIIKNKPEVTLIFTDGDFSPPNFTGVHTDIIWLIEDDPTWTTSYGKVFHYTL
jgi:predicted metal-dependent peptidase